MEWQVRMTRALERLESQVHTNLDIEAAAREANCSVFHFCRMFEVITGIGPAEYVRRRRLSLAALTLQSSNDRIIDIALNFGYESPDAFAKAFKREFNCLPSEVRQGGRSLHNYPPLSFQIVLKGNIAMEYRIEKGPAIRLFGISLQTHNQKGNNFLEVPAFWDRSFANGDFQKLSAACQNKDLGVVGVCHNWNTTTGTFTYSIAIQEPQEKHDLPDKCQSILVPVSTWAKFTSHGPINPNFQNLIKRIFSEWFPSSGREHAGSPEIEFYNCSSVAPTAAEYQCEYWVPLK